MARLRIAAVSYLNTVTFVHGMAHEAEKLRADVVLQVPSLCAESLLKRRVDVALVPVAALLGAPSLKTVTPYCIGASGPVRTVVVMSPCPIEEVETIMLDSHSRTSAALTELLCRERWGINPKFAELTDYSSALAPSPRTAYLLIGDKVFDYEGALPYSYDLASEWTALTSMPFVFAAWAAHPDVPDERIAALEEALAYGVTHTEEAVAASRYASMGRTAVDYLTRNIDFDLDIDKRRALELFLRKIAPVSC